MKIKRLLLILAMALLAVSVKAFTPDEARRVYDGASLSKEDSPYMEIGDYVFIKVQWTVEADDSPDARDEKELSAIFDAIEKYLAPPKAVYENPPFGDNLMSWLIPVVEFKLPNVASTTVKVVRQNGENQKVIAFDAAEMKAAKAECAKSVPDVEHWTRNDWVKALVSAKKNFKTESEKQKFHSMLGCPIVNLILSKSAMSKSETDEAPAQKELNALLNWSPKTGSVFAEHPEILWPSYKNKGQGVFFPEWSEDDGGAFDEAEDLYLKGKDITKVISLLVKSISVNPVGAKKWEYLGGVLKVSGKYEDAIMAYIQSLRFDSKSTWAWKGLLESCEKSVMPSNAKGLDWYLRMEGIIK